MTEDTRDTVSEAQKPAQPLMRFNIYSQLDLFVDTLELTPAHYRTLDELHFKLIPADVEDHVVTQWLYTADAELSPEELADRENAYYDDVTRSEYEQRGDDYDPCVNPALEGEDDE